MVSEANNFLKLEYPSNVRKLTINPANVFINSQKYNHYEIGNYQ